MAYEEINECLSSGGKHYEWQLNVGGRWQKIENDHVIEVHYCHAGAKGIMIISTAGKLFINFDTLRTDNPSIRVQRLSFLPADQPEVHSWFYRGDRLWTEYGSQGSNSSSSISSGEIERHFSLNPAGTLQFSVGTANYSLDFSTMTQTNQNTSMRRKVRRRPKYTAQSGGLSAAMTPPATPPQPPPLPSWLEVTWEFLGDRSVWTEYQSDVCSYGSADIERAYQSDSQGQLKFTAGKYSYTLDFSGMFQINDSLKTKRKVRRTQHTSSPAAVAAAAVVPPRWQFQDVDGQWMDYVKGNGGCSISSQDVELRYQQDPSGSLDFSTAMFRYRLDFTDMTQTNVSTNTSRDVRRLLQQ
ncbi:uncharacterized protein LOC115404518 [Salarias fasciatus]|uniref:Uncharacterized LOC115404518 n=1 Tax=Salarias fasciatus TaxID=181472 RepID=A0A672GWS5_SALFA|nr:uncharacterized protein LOC115404518 [Salarias fasciatus]